jgi:aminopeptidase N
MTPTLSIRTRAAVFAFALCCLPVRSASAQQAATEHPVRSHDYDVQHYRLDLSFDWAKRMVIGETTVTLRPFGSNFREVELDAGEMTVSAARLAGGAPLRFDYDGKEKLRVRLDRAYAAGEDVAVTVAYTAVPKRGLTFITPNEDDPTRPYQIWTQGETETNHYWFPCYDSPNDRATSETNVTVDDKYRVISNGTLVAVDRDERRHTATYRWRMDQPFSSYLESIVVGEFDEVAESYGSIPVVSYVPKGMAEEGRLSLGKIDRMVAFFSDVTGVKYPYTKYAQTTVRDFGGGQENISATTLGDFAVHDRRAHVDFSSDPLLAHELAHQWFGDLLTCRDWSEIWLNESFATYFEHLWTEHDLGRDDMLYEVLGDHRAAFGAWGTGNRRPIVTKHYVDANQLFDTYAYPRGGAVLHMLRSVLGDELWWKAIRRYLEANAYGNVETTQLRIAVEQATGQNLDWFFDEWIWKMGHPELEVSYTYDGAAHVVRLKVRQTQKAPEKSEYPFAGIFKMPVDVAVTTASGEHVERVWLDAAEQEFAIAADSEPLIVNFDRGGTLIKRLTFQKPTAELAYQAEHDADAMGRIWAVNEMQTRGGEATAALAAVLAKDPFWGARVEAARALGTVKSPAAKAALVAGAKDRDPRVRGTVVNALAGLADPELADFFIAVMREDESLVTAGSAARALGATRSPKAFDALVAELEVPSFRSMLTRAALDGLAALKDPRGLDVALRYAAPPNPPAVRGDALDAAVVLGKGEPRVRERLFALLVGAARSPSTDLKFAGVGGLGALGDARALPVLRELGAAGAVDIFGGSFQRAVEQATHAVEAAQAKPEPSLTGNTTFRLKGHADAKTVALAGDFNGWNVNKHLFGRVGDEWVCRVDLAPGKHFYKFVVDGEWMTDPDNPATANDGSGNVNSVIEVGTK